MMSIFKVYKQALLGIIFLLFAGICLAYTYVQVRHARLEGIWTEKVEENGSRLVIQGNEVILENMYSLELGHYFAHQIFEISPYSDQFSYVRQSSYNESSYSSGMSEKEISDHYQTYRDLIKVHYTLVGDSLMVTYDYSQSNKHFYKLWEEASDLNESTYFFSFLKFDENRELVDKQTIQYYRGQ